VSHELIGLHMLNKIGSWFFHVEYQMHPAGHLHMDDLSADMQSYLSFTMDPKASVGGVIFIVIGQAGNCTSNSTIPGPAMMITLSKSNSEPQFWTSGHERRSWAHAEAYPNEAPPSSPPRPPRGSPRSECAEPRQTRISKACRTCPGARAITGKDRVDDGRP
jgi:hypothetical protein